MFSRSWTLGQVLLYHCGVRVLFVLFLPTQLTCCCHTPVSWEHVLNDFVLCDIAQCYNALGTTPKFFRVTTSTRSWFRVCTNTECRIGTSRVKARDKHHVLSYPNSNLNFHETAHYLWNPSSAEHLSIRILQWSRLHLWYQCLWSGALKARRFHHVSSLLMLPVTSNTRNNTVSSKLDPKDNVCVC